VKLFDVRRPPIRPLPPISYVAREESGPSILRLVRGGKLAIVSASGQIQVQSMSGSFGSRRFYQVGRGAELGTYNPSLASVTCMDVSSSERIAAFGSTDGGTFLCSVTTDQQKATDLYVNEARWIASVPSRNPIVSPCYISVSNEEPASSVSFLPCMSAKDRENASKSLFSSNIPVETMSKPLLVTPAKRLASVRTSL